MTPHTTRIRTVHTAILAWAFCLFFPSVHGAGLSAQQIKDVSKAATDWLETHHVPGIAVAVARNDVIWSAGFGKADLEQDVPATAHSLFRTASVAKWFTATAAMRLVEQGKLDLDAPIQRYCPQFPEKPWPITSRELLSHMAGVRHNYGNNGEKQDTDAERKALDELIQRERSTQYTRYTDVIKPLDAFKDDPLLFQPGTSTHYSSLGYRLLGCVLQGADQTPYRQLMRELVFTPAGMTSTTEDDALALIPHRVAGYSRGADDSIVRADFRDVSENLPAGGYLATAEDLVRFVLAFRSGKLVSLKTRDRMVERPKLLDGSPAPNPMGDSQYYYGMGIMVDPGDAQPAWFHTGGQSGASTLLFLFPRDNVVVAVMSNMDHAAVREPLARKIGEIAARH
jgi:serine beta-lactamase-like protein LACTB, mitochondrial